jgi:chromosome segregation ATPase
MSDSDRYAQAEGPETTIREFSRAAGRLVTALAVAASSTEATALECVFELHEAFGQLTSALAVLPEVISRADAGSRVETQLKQRQAETAAAAAGLARVRANLDALAEVERDMRAIEAERAVLTVRLAELEQASTRAGQLSAMRDRIAALEAATAPADTDDLADRLSGALTRFQELTGEQRSALGPQLERAIGEAQAADEDLRHARERKAELDSDIIRLASETDEVTEAIKSGLPALAGWRSADAAMADALATAGVPDAGTTLERLRTLLAELTERMNAVDDALGPLHASYTKARDEALAIRNLTTPAA